MKLVFAAKADHDLESIGDYIAQDNVRRALSYVREMRRWCRTLTRHPHRFPAASGFGAGLRRVPYGNYIIFYSIHSDQVLIERVIHSARDIRKADFS